MRWCQDRLWAATALHFWFSRVVEIPRKMRRLEWKTGGSKFKTQQLNSQILYRQMKLVWLQAPWPHRNTQCHMQTVKKVATVMKRRTHSPQLLWLLRQAGGTCAAAGVMMPVWADSDVLRESYLPFITFNQNSRHHSSVVLESSILGAHCAFALYCVVFDITKWSLAL